MKHEDVIVQAVKATWRVNVNYDLSLMEMIVAGRYDWISDRFPTKEYFPVKGKGIKDLDVELVNFNRFISSREALEEMRKMGLCSATREELLAFGAKYPDMQREFPISALGSFVRFFGGGFGALVLYGDSSQRILGHHNFGFGWHECCCFLTVRNRSI